MQPIEILVTAILDAFRRIRTLLFVLVMGCALLIANQYLDHYSFDEAQLDTSAPMLERLKELSEQEKDPIKKSVYQARIARVSNSLAEFKFRSLTLPIIGLTIPTNDLNVVIGIFLIPVGVWIIFSLNQIRMAVEQQETGSELRQYFPYLRHAGLFLYSKNTKPIFVVMPLAVFALPGLTLALLTIDDFHTILSYDLSDVTIKTMFPTYVARVLVMTVATITLALVGWSLHQSRNRLSQILSNNNVKPVKQRATTKSPKIERAE